MNKIHNIITATLLCSLMSGCGLYSKYERSEEVEKIDNLYNYADADQSESIASLSWRELFTDVKLQALIESGLKSNTDLNIARENLKQAEIALHTARLAFIPSLSLSPTGQTSSLAGDVSKSYSISASSSWEVDIFGKLRNAKEQSKAAMEQSKAYQQAIETELIAAIAGSYYSLLLLDEQLEISTKTAENWDDNYRVMSALMRAGRINQTSVLQTDASRISLKRSIVAIKQQIKELENSLSSLLAIEPQKIERGTMQQTSFPDKLSVGVPLELLSRRPDVRAAELGLAQAFYATAEARSSLYPSITLTGSAAYTGDMLYSLIGSLVQPIFNRGVLRAEVKISASEQEQALLSFKQALLDAGIEVNTALISWQGAREKIEYDLLQMEVLAKAVKSSEMLLKHGNVNYLEVLTAQLSLLSSELTYSENKYAEIQGVIDLYRSLGGGAQ
ncbi:MAG: TolC family protein [Rikenellaceae bacterium]